MSSPNGNGTTAASSAIATAVVAPKRRKVSTTESTSSVNSNKDDQQQQQQPAQISPARTSRRIAGKERSYSHKFGYGEDEAILLLDDGKAKGSPRKSISLDGKEDWKSEPKKKPAKRSEASKADPSPSKRPSKAAESNAKPKRTSLDEKKEDKSEILSPPNNDNEQKSIEVKVKVDSEVIQQVTTEPKEESDQNLKEKDGIAVGCVIVKQEEDGPPPLQEATVTPEVNNSSSVKSEASDDKVLDKPPVLKSEEEPPKRKNANRAAKTSAVTALTTPIRRTRQAINEEAQKGKEASVTKLPSVEAPKSVSNDTSFKASLPAKKRPIEAKHRNLDTSTPPKLHITASQQAGAYSSTNRAQEYPNATVTLIEELKSNKNEQSLIIEEFRRNRDEQQKVIDDLRKHRELQEKLIEDLRKSRNEKEAEVEKLRAQQRASSILFHRERDVPLSRYDMSDDDRGPSDNEEDFGSVDNNASPREAAPPGKNPFTIDTVLAKVMDFTSSSDLVNCRLVNKQWDKVAGNAYKKNRMVALKYGVTDFMNVVQTSSALFPLSGFNLYLTEAFVKDTNTEVFVRRYSSHIKRLKLTLEYFYTDLIPINHLRQFLPPNLPNLEHLVLKLPCKYLSLPINPAPEEDYEPFLNNTSTKLKTLKVVCQCTPIPHLEPTTAGTHFQRGLLTELIENSPNLTLFELKSGRYDTNKTLLRRVVDVLDRVNLPKLQHLSLRGLEFQDLQAPGFLPNYKLKSLHLNAVPWDRVEAMWIQHRTTLESVTIGKLVGHLELNSSSLANYVFPCLKELIVHPTIDDPSILASFSRLFPSLRKLELHNPYESTVLNIWKELTNLEELVLDYSNEVGENEKYKILHLDSLLSGFSVNNCELILKKIMKKGLPQNLDFDAMERFGQGHSIQSMTKLQKLVITSRSTSIPFRITEVGLVLVLLRMKSLTSITINPCVLMKDTMKQLLGRISPAINLSITCPEKEDDYESAKIALL